MTRFAQSLRTLIVAMSVAALVSVATALLTPQALDAQGCWTCWYNPNANDDMDYVHCADTGMFGLTECQEPNGTTCELSGFVCNWLASLEYSEDGTVSGSTDHGAEPVRRGLQDSAEVPRSCDGVILGSYRRDTDDGARGEPQLTLDL